jgi:PleD family two-component response regulator
VRYGGDEFLVVMGGATRSDAEHILDRLRDGLTDVSFSAGIAEYFAGVTSPQDLVDRADRDLYAGRRARATAAARSDMPQRQPSGVNS